VYDCILNNIYWLNNTKGINHLKEENKIGGKEEVSKDR
jgi:hypothetical protein